LTPSHFNFHFTTSSLQPRESGLEILALGLSMTRKSVLFLANGELPNLIGQSEKNSQSLPANWTSCAHGFHGIDSCSLAKILFFEILIW